MNRRISQFRVTAAARLAWALCLLTLLVVAATILLVVQNLASIRSPDEAYVIEIILPIGFAAAGLHEAMPLRDAGHHELRGVPGEWQLFEVVSP